uniref:MICOS complex subunit MIC13 n=1 Tax=Ciona intestinalis TaxID=7719 RepID=H2Y2U4_CIOIN
MALWSATKFVAKGGVLGGAVYLTTKNGIWGENPDTGIRAIKQFSKSVDGTLGGEYMGKVTQLPQLNATEKWNKAVSYSIDCVADSPAIAAKAYKTIKDKII